MQIEPITTTHSGIFIVYNENTNNWQFTLRGRDRSAPSLVAAKEAIDKPVPEKAKPFEKIAAWEITIGDTPSRVDITGIAEGSYRRDQLWVWIKGTDGQRRKHEASYRIYPSTPANDLLANGIIGRRKEIEKLEKECEKLRQQLTALTLEIPA